jgi:metal-sulfur cluster biosynthetic enzyme
VSARDEVRLRAALDTVRDPELDTSIVELGFVESCTLDADGTARVRLRLPTFFCAPNFAFLMVADAHDAVAGVDGVARTEIVLEDHFAAGEINAGVAAKAGFVAAFDGLAQDELDDLRRDFLRKAMLAAQDRVVRPLLASGLTMDGVAALRLGDVPDTSARRRLEARRAELGIPCGAGDPLLVTPDGRAVPRREVPVHLRRTRTIRVGIEANSDYCRQLLDQRYGRPAGAAHPS